MPSEDSTFVSSTCCNFPFLHLPSLAFAFLTVAEVPKQGLKSLFPSKPNFYLKKMFSAVHGIQIFCNLSLPILPALSSDAAPHPLSPSAVTDLPP